MIARVWRGWATASSADDYQRHYESTVAEHLRAVPGFVDAQLLRYTDGGEWHYRMVVRSAAVADVDGCVRSVATLLMCAATRTHRW